MSTCKLEWSFILSQCIRFINLVRRQSLILFHVIFIRKVLGLSNRYITMIIHFIWKTIKFSFPGIISRLSISYEWYLSRSYDVQFPFLIINIFISQGPDIKMVMIDQEKLLKMQQHVRTGGEHQTVDIFNVMLIYLI